MFRIIPVPLHHDLTFIGKTRGNTLPLGLRTMLERTFEIMETLGFKPSAIVVGDEENFLVRAQNAVLQLPNGNAPISSAESLQLVESWASLLKWYSWWSMPHWKNETFNGRIYSGQCTTCGKFSQSNAQFDKCLHDDCPSHVNWHTVNGVAAS